MTMTGTYWRLPEGLGSGVVKSLQGHVTDREGCLSVYVPGCGYLLVPRDWLKEVAPEIPTEPKPGAYSIVGGDYDTITVFRIGNGSKECWILNGVRLTWRQLWDNVSAPGARLVQMIPDPEDVEPSTCAGGC